MKLTAWAASQTKCGGAKKIGAVMGIQGNKDRLGDHGSGW